MRFIAVLLLYVPSLVIAQSSDISPYGPAYQMMDRMDILGTSNQSFPTETKPFTRRDIRQYADEILRSDSLQRNTILSSNLQYLLDDTAIEGDPVGTSNQTRKRHYLYDQPATLFAYNNRWLHLRANPLLQLQAGQDRKDTAQWVFQSQVGAELSGELGSKIDFYTSFLTAWARFPNYVNEWTDRYKAVPTVGEYSSYNGGVFDATQARRYNVAVAHLSVQATRHITLQTGYGRHFLGNGYRSLLLSDAGAPMAFFKINTHIWKIEYQNLFVQLKPFSSGILPDELLTERKYMAAHYLNFKFTKDFSIGLYEATVFSRKNNFELQYLNPVILYRSVEGMIGSPDNVLIGLDGRWNVGHKVQIYGQLMMDEFLFSELRNWQGWWGNKFAIQAGVKYINALGVDHLDLQVEYNRVRPYMYSHFDSLNSYTNFSQPLAHPLGGNFGELVSIIRWQPIPKLFLSARYLHIVSGDDVDGRNFGTNPLLTYISRPRDYGNYVGQGIPAQTHIFGLDASWMFRHNMFVDLKILVRRKQSREAAFSTNTQLFSTGLRINLWSPPSDL